jgi:hypothetical protein
MNTAILKNEKHQMVSGGVPKIIKENLGVISKFRTCNTHQELLVEYPCGRRTYMSQKEFNSLN